MQRQVLMDRQTQWLVFAFCSLKLALHLVADYHSGFQGDELLHIEAGHHLAWGYMEFPPLIGLLAFIQNSFQSDSVFVHHIFAHIASLLIFVFVARTVVELGGKSKAVLLVLLCLLPVMGRSHQLFQPVVFSQLFWILSFFQLTRYVKYLDRKYLWYLTFTLALGFLTKYDAVFFVFGLLALFVFEETRKALIRHRFWWNILAFLVLISPNLIWQYLHDFPVLKMFDRLYETQLNQLSTATVLLGLIIALNPLTLMVSIPALFGMAHKQMAKYRPLAIAILLSFLLLVFSNGKSYYFYPIILTLLPFGGVFWENNLLVKKKWLIYPVTLILLISGMVLIPFSFPLTSLDSYLENEYKYEKKEISGGKYAVKEERYAQAKWAETMHELKKVVDSLPADEQVSVLIWGKHYGQAGAVNLLGPPYALPPSFSLHGSFYNWVPSGDMPQTVIAIRYSQRDGKDFFEPYFEEVVPVASIYNPYADKEERVWQTIFVCKVPRQDFDGLKKQFENRIFE